jgi:aspartyl-tRNA(Asn)/glutamyl-tRNA(Gln) amidotransferase subunit B
MSKNYVPTIGLEIHAELKTATKMFCDCLNNPDEEKPNHNVCPICMGHPGTLPTLNKEAIKHVLKVGHAIDADIADFTEWDRKNYFYPDIPKGYQISQYKYPLVSGGKIGDVEITRIHLEEDTGTSQHDKGDFSLVNYNRAGVPLMELVTEPVIYSAKQAGDFARDLQLLLRYLGVSEANMEKGEMRVEANISVGPADENGNPAVDEKGKRIFGTKVEVKNLNSFKVVEKAIEFEIARMLDLIEEGREKEIVQETRGWDELKQRTFSQRLKESSDDYRYFPEPDLPKLKISEIPEFSAEKLRSELPELPWEKRVRLQTVGLSESQADFFVQFIKYDTILEYVIHNLEKDQNFSPEQKSKFITLSANYLSSDVAAIVKNEGENIFEKLTGENFFLMIKMIVENKISSRGAKDILLILVREGGDSKKIANEKGLIQQSDEGALQKIAEQVISENPKVVEEYRAGKEMSIKFLMGQGMKLSKGSANPQVLEELIKKIISN